MESDRDTWLLIAPEGVTLGGLPIVADNVVMTITLKLPDGELVNIDEVVRRCMSPLVKEG